MCLGVLALRLKEPELLRPFKAPAIHVVAPLGAAASLLLMFGLPLDTWLRLGGWLAIGLLLYGCYGIRHRRAAAQQSGSLGADRLPSS